MLKFGMTGGRCRHIHTAAGWGFFLELVLLLGPSGCARFDYDTLPLRAELDPRAVSAGGGRNTVQGAGAASCSTLCADVHGKASCEAGRCVVSCQLGYADCDGDPTNGCEVDAAATASTCGGCELSCGNPHGATECTAGLCAPTCDPGYGDCDRNPTNGCEQPLDSVADCGACRLVCNAVNAATQCVAGRCLAACTSGFGDCDGNTNDGCESDLNNDPSHCGACANACAASGQICASGSCVASPCAPGRGECDSDPTLLCETDVNTALEHCGFCSHVCTVANGTPACSGGECSIERCDSGFGDCDGLPANGCETPLATTATHCGACGAACTNANGNVGCSGATCIPTCSTGYGDCDTSRQNGCETALDSVDNCGACGNTCPANGGTPVCNAGVCDTICDLSGTFALEMNMAGSWPRTTNIAAGSGTFNFWLKAQTAQAGTTVAATVTECGRFMPEVVNRVGEGFLHGYPDRLFDGNFLPSSSVSLTLSKNSPGATLTWPVTANQMGIDLANPKTDPWPSAASGIPGASRIDTDGDGKPGVTGTFATGATLPRTSAAAFGFNRADLPYFAARVVFSLSGTLSSCSESSGAATVSSSDLRVFGCDLAGSTQDCSATEASFMDANTTVATVGAASYVLRRVADGADCAAIRAAFP